MIRTYCFPGVLRGRPGPRLATTPTNRPRRSLSSPGMRYASSVAPRRGQKNDAVPGRLRNLSGLARRLVPIGGAASHLVGLALCGSVPRLDETYIRRQRGATSRTTSRSHFGANAAVALGAAASFAASTPLGAT